MGLFSKKGGGGGKRVRIFYATDVHGWSAPTASS